MILFLQKRTIISLFVILIIVIASCTQKAVVITPDPTIIKDSGSSFAFLGEPIKEGNSLVLRLCKYDIDKILAFSDLSEEKANKAKELLCGQSSSIIKFKKFFDSLTSHERNNLVRAFELFGYDINAYGC